MYCTMTIFTDTVKSVIENVRMRDDHMDNVWLHTYIDTYRYSDFCSMLLLYTELAQARPKIIFEEDELKNVSPSP